MKRREPKPFDRLTCRAPGLEHFHEIVEAAAAGRAPAQATVEALAAAARYLFTEGKARERLEAFGRELGMYQRQGRAPDESAGTHAKRISLVGFVVQAERRLMAEGLKLRAAGAAALTDVSDRKGVPPRTLARWVRELREEAITRLDEFEVGRQRRAKSAD